jgi:serine/threonine-protein kinase
MSSIMKSILAGHYQIVRHLGGGGFGQTFLAKDSHLPGNPLCVVKQLKPRVADQAMLQTAKRLFDREAETLYQLGGHDQIPRLMAHFEQEQEFYLVQEFIEGQPLNQELTPGKQLSEAYVIALMRDILQVLAFVHQQNVIHRDIKPPNLIRRSRDSKIVLIDFGAVKEVNNQAANVHGQTNLTVAISSPGYTPSEQQLGRPNFSSDIYAVGIVCIQALTGLHPKKLPKDSHTDELYCALFSNLAPVSPGLAAILDRMVRYDYRQRYFDATVALQALQQLIVGSEPDSSQASKVLSLRQLEPTSRSLDEPEGQVGLDSAFYVERPPTEADCYETIMKPGALIRIKAPRQMGKSSLLTRILHHATQRGCQPASLNFQSVDAEFLTSLDQFLQWFCASITYELNLKDKLTEYWKGVLGSKNKCTNYFQRYLLSEITSPVALGLDEVDRLFQHPELATDFFGLLRAWHEKSKNEAIWKKLRLVIVHSKEVYIPLNINQSPFNVGLPIILSELNQSQVQDLVQRHGLNWTREQVERLMVMVGGHPYLVRGALYQIARGRMTLSQLLQIAPIEEGMYSDHLRRHLSNLKEDADLLAAIKQVVSGPEPVRIETGLAFKLRSMGLVKFQGNDVTPLCDLYRQYFRYRLGVS